jgi:hypothetical protein
MLVNRFNLSQSFNYAHYLFYNKLFKTEINCFCIRTQDTMSSMERIMMLSEPPQTSSGQLARQLSTSSTGSCQFQVGWSSGGWKDMTSILADQ